MKPVYLIYKHVANKEEAIHYLESENIWKITTKPQRKTTKKTAGIHEFYRCKICIECPVKICLVLIN